ncbi:MAG TPA: hypothetical protein VL326_23920, partial [Kofleriaceae bacterium]|nr:hypothetical protein [Kofleriaceae bacterium]
MISPELDLHDLDARHWRNGWRLLAPPRVLDEPRWALVIIDGSPDRVIKVILAGKDARGSIDPASAPLPGVTHKALELYAKQLGVGSVIVADRTLIVQLSSEIEAALRFDQDGIGQALVALRALKKHAGKGVWTEPPLLDLLPTPSLDPIQRT